MSPSGAELLRRIKSQIDEVDPAEVKELLAGGRDDRRRARQRRVRDRAPAGRQERAARPPRVAHRGRRPRPHRGA